MSLLLSPAAAAQGAYVSPEKKISMFHILVANGLHKNNYY